MKKYKELKTELLNEGEYMDGGALGGFPAKNSTRSAFSDEGTYRVENPEILQRLQAFLNAFTGKEYLEPRSALSLLRVKLNLAGLDFDFNNKIEVRTGAPLVFKIKRFGGTFGHSVSHDLSKGFEVTDGLESPINLIIDIQEAPSGLYKINAKFVHPVNSEEGEMSQTEEA
jgi:hypothetical protein